MKKTIITLLLATLIVLVIGHIYKKPVTSSIVGHLPKNNTVASIGVVTETAKVVEPEKPPTPPPTPVVAAPTGSCGDWIAQAGVTDVGNALILINRESGCNPNAVNKSSGACGIPQALPCSKLGTNDPVEQIKWMQNYVFSRYGSWANAVAHSNSTGWY